MWTRRPPSRFSIERLTPKGNHSRRSELSGSPEAGCSAATSAVAPAGRLKLTLSTLPSSNPRHRHLCFLALVFPIVYSKGCQCALYRSLDAARLCRRAIRGQTGMACIPCSSLFSISGTSEDISRHDVSCRCELPIDKDGHNQGAQ